MFKEEVFHKIFNSAKNGEEYCFIDNRYKTWILPYKNMKQATEMFSSYSRNGNLIKYIFPYIKWSRLARKKAGCERITVSLNTEITDMIEKYVDKPYQCAVYFGNLDTEQNYKATIQVFHKKETLLYIKISNALVVKDAFEREKKALENLRQKGIEKLPMAVGIEKAGQWDALIQRPENGKLSVCNVFGDRQWRFLENLYKVTVCECDYHSTDLYGHLKYLSDIVKNNGFYKKEMIQKALACADSYLEQEVTEFSFAHGDFTPWNMKETETGIYVYDFEYCMNTAVPFMDYFHYICQREIMKNENDITRVIQILEEDKEKICKYIENPEKVFVVYLLFIISFYVKRNNGKANENSGRFWFRMSLLEQLLQKM